MSSPVCEAVSLLKARPASESRNLKKKFLISGLQRFAKKDIACFEGLLQNFNKGSRYGDVDAAAFSIGPRLATPEPVATTERLLSSKMTIHTKGERNLDAPGSCK